MITQQTKRRQDLITQLMRADRFYGTMYGMHKSKDRVIEINIRDIHKFVFDWDDKGPAIIYLWGWPGPDGNVYLIDDYGETWAFSETELTIENSESRK